jgi:transaldolase
MQYRVLKRKSLRFHTEFLHIVRCAEAGADVCTCPLEPILGLLKHPLTDIGLAKFLADAKGTK